MKHEFVLLLAAALVAVGCQGGSGHSQPSASCGATCADAGGTGGGGSGNDAGVTPDGSAGASGSPDAGADAGPDPYASLVQIHVDVNNPNASDTNDGSASAPFKTIDAALGAAIKNRRSGKGTRIWVHPGTYRESIDRAFGDDGPDPIVIQATKIGGATITGSDLWSGWTKDSASGLYTHAWKYDWGVAPNPWSGSVTIGEIALRREMFFANGTWLAPELKLVDAQATQGSFYVDETANLAYIHLPAGMDIGSTAIEVAVRPTLFRPQGLNHLVVRGLVFEHASNAIPDDAVDIVDESDVTLEDCTVRWNSWSGLSLKGDNLSVLRTTMTHNGESGIDGFEVNGALLDSDTLTYNNWRGALGGFTGWDAGNKFSLTRDLTIKNLVSTNNQTRGFWLDSDNQRTHIDGARLCNNLTDGIFIEANQGPIDLVNSTICDNQQFGVLTSASKDLTFKGDTIENNGHDQIGISGDLDRSVTDWQTGTVTVLNNESWTITNNVIADGANTTGMIYGTSLPQDHWNNWAATLTAGGNTYHDPSRTNVFALATSTTDFAGWQSATGQDSTSTFTSP